MHLQSLCRNFIDVKIIEETGLVWRATFVYGEPKTELRHIFMLIYVRQSKMQTFNFISESMWRRVQGWSDRPMSRPGREIMLKSVAQAILTYITSCFLLPDGVCESMRKTISIHWWGMEGGRKKMHWKS